MKKAHEILSLFLALTAPLSAADTCAAGETIVKPLKSLQGAEEADRRMPANNKNGWALEVAKNPDPALSGVLLIGDSILSGYKSGVVEGLAGKANVDAWVTPIHQGAPGVFQQFKEVVSQSPYAVIHFNMGLHGYPKGRIPDGQYEMLTRILVNQIKTAAPQAKIIWASTTPIMLKGFEDVVDPELNPIIVNHNAMAAQIMDENKIPINDLYSLMLTNIPMRAKDRDGVGDMFHWSSPAKALQARAVTKIIEQALSSRRNWTPPVWDAYRSNGPTGQNLPDFSLAGYHSSKIPIPSNPATLSIADFGAIPGDGRDDGAAIQAAINEVERKGGGIVYFPPGDYDLNSTPSLGTGEPVANNYGLVVTNSGVVLRGSGSGSGGTVLHQHNTALSTSGKDGVPTSLVRFSGSGKQGAKVPVTADAKRGGRLLTVESTTPFKAGQIIKLTLLDPEVDPVNPVASKADLTRAMVDPFDLRDDLKSYLHIGAAGGVFMLLEIGQIVSPNCIRLSQPLRMDLFTRWKPTISSFESISEVGIEGIRFESDWKGGFSHHKPFPIDAKGGDYVKGGEGILRTAQEQNYSWSALSFSHVSHGWARDLCTHNYTQDITLSRCKFMTIEGIQITGQKGHTAITLSRSFDNLIRNVTITAPRVHCFFTAGFSSGNVFTRSRFLYGPYDQESQCDTCLDFHGYAPCENLYDNIENAYVYPGGALDMLPHAGVRNVFWNIKAPSRMLRGGESGEFFRTYAPTSSGNPLSDHEHWPKSFLIGVHREGGKVTVNGRDGDRSDEWLTIQGLNRPGVVPESLYEAQKAISPLPNLLPEATPNLSEPPIKNTP